MLSMHPLAILFLIALALGSASSIILGDRFDRIVAMAMLLAFALTLGMRAIETVRFGHLSIGIMAVDAALAIVVTWAATRTQRWWIILMASVLIFPVLGHMAKLAEPTLWPGGYWLMTNAPALPCVLLLMVGAEQARRQRRTNAAIISPSCSAAASKPRTRQRT